LAGSVPSEGARKSVRDLSRQLFERPGLDDRLEVASGAPKNWDKAVAAALRALSRLETGKVALSGSAVSIEGIAPDQGTAVAVSSQLRRDLPERFSTSESIKWKEAATHLNSDPGTAQDVAATIIPRIKVSPRNGQVWRSGSLPPLFPLGGEH
jgi:OOP family OmpA-OmpF porin